MAKAGSIVRAISRCGHFRAVAAVTTAAVEKLRQIHQTSPVATAALGRALSGAFLLASDLKGDERVMIQILGNGPLGEIFVEADQKGNGRGYVRNNQVQLPLRDGKIPVGSAVGSKGTLTVIKDLYLREPYRGVVPITSGEIGKDLAYYLTVSEQVPSAVALGVYVDRDLVVKAAGGYLVQTLPGAGDDEISAIEDNIRGLPVPTELIREGLSPEEILSSVLGGFEPKFFEPRPTRFHCHCCRDRVSRVLVALGAAELRKMIQEERDLEISCEFCRASYTFTKQELGRLLASALQDDAVSPV